MTYSAAELEATILGMFPEDYDPSDYQIGQILQGIIAPNLFDNLEWGIKAQETVWTALGVAHRRELEQAMKVRA